MWFESPASDQATQSSASFLRDANKHPRVCQGGLPNKLPNQQISRHQNSSPGKWVNTKGPLVMYLVLHPPSSDSCLKIRWRSGYTVCLWCWVWTLLEGPAMLLQALCVFMTLVTSNDSLLFSWKKLHDTVTIIESVCNWSITRNISGIEHRITNRRTHNLEFDIQDTIWNH